MVAYPPQVRRLIDAAERRAVIYNRVNAGERKSAIARELGISPQRVHQLYEQGASDRLSAAQSD